MAGSLGASVFAITSNFWIEAGKGNTGGISPLTSPCNTECKTSKISSDASGWFVLPHCASVSPAVRHRKGKPDLDAMLRVLRGRRDRPQ